MSIWSSIAEGIDGAQRHNHTGKQGADPVDAQLLDYYPAPHLDIATATWANDCIRLTVCDQQTLITQDEAIKLIELLNQALNLISLEIGAGA